MLVAVGREALKIVLDKEFAEECRVLMLHGDEPGQDHGEVENDSRPPERPPKNGPLPAQECECDDDARGEEWCNRTLGQRGQPGKEIDIVEPEFRIGFIPCIPAEEAYGERCGHLHVGGGASREADDACAGDSDECRIQMAAGTKTTHMQINEADHDKGEGGRRETGTPIVDAEILKKEHGAPVVESRFFKPGMAVEIRGDTGAELVAEGVGGVEAAEHLVGNLRIARLVGTDETQAVAAEDGRESIEKKEDGESEEDDEFGDAGGGRHSPANLVRCKGIGRMEKWF